MEQKGDICKLHGTDLESVDLIVSGSPCQNISLAGNRRGLDGSESRLFFEQMRIIRELQETNGALHFLLWENVANILACNGGNDFKRVLVEIIKIVDEKASKKIEKVNAAKNDWKKAGMLIGDTYSVAWRVTNARFFGIPQSRRRIAVLADFNGKDAPDILFGTKPLTEPVTEAEHSVMSYVFSEGQWKESQEEIRKHCNYGESPEQPLNTDIMDVLDPYAPVEYYLSEKACKGIIKRAQHRNKKIDPVLEIGFNGNISADPKRKGLPDGIPVIIETLRQNGYGDYKAGSFSGALKASGGDAGCGSECLVVTRFDRRDKDPAYAVRKLSVTECERIQGLPENWTDIGCFETPSGRRYKKTPLSYRGKAIGNSISIPQWIYILSGIYNRCQHKTMASLFDGIGAFPLIWTRLGGQAVWNSEIDPYACEVTRRRFK